MHRHPIVRHVHYPESQAVGGFLEKEKTGRTDYFNISLDTIVFGTKRA